MLAAEALGNDVPTTSRTWRPLLFPGAGYDLAETATGVRGTVTDAGKPVRWARIEASANGRVIGRAHGDDRGEFLLVLGQNTGAVGDLASPLAVTITVLAREPGPAGEGGRRPRRPAGGDGRRAGRGPDDVSAGITLPDHYVQVAQLPDHPLTLGRLSSVPIAV